MGKAKKWSWPKKALTLQETTNHMLQVTSFATI